MQMWTHRTSRAALRWGMQRATAAWTASGGLTAQPGWRDRQLVPGRAQVAACPAQSPCSTRGCPACTRTTPALWYLSCGQLTGSGSGAGCLGSIMPMPTMWTPRAALPWTLPKNAGVMKLQPSSASQSPSACSLRCNAGMERRFLNPVQHPIERVHHGCNCFFGQTKAQWSMSCCAACFRSRLCAILAC